MSKCPIFRTAQKNLTDIMFIMLKLSNFLRLYQKKGWQYLFHV